MMQNACRHRRAVLLTARLLLVALLGAQWGCGPDTRPTFTQLTASVPPIPDGHGRIVAYMTPNEREATGNMKVDGTVAGTVYPGEFLFFDSPAGDHEIHLRRSPIYRASTTSIVQVPEGDTIFIEVVHLGSGQLSKAYWVFGIPSTGSGKLAILLQEPNVARQLIANFRFEPKRSPLSPPLIAPPPPES